MVYCHKTDSAFIESKRCNVMDKLKNGIDQLDSHESQLFLLFTLKAHSYSEEEQGQNVFNPLYCATQAPRCLARPTHSPSYSHFVSKAQPPMVSLTLEFGAE